MFKIIYCLGLFSVFWSDFRLPVSGICEVSIGSTYFPTSTLAYSSQDLYFLDAFERDPEHRGILSSIIAFTYFHLTLYWRMLQTAAPSAHVCSTLILCALTINKCVFSKIGYYEVVRSGRGFLHNRPAPGVYCCQNFKAFLQSNSLSPLLHVI